MDKTLLVFLSSNRVDSYINAVAYAFDKMNVRAVKLVYVRGTKTGLREFEASSLTNQIWNRLEYLASNSDIYKRMNERLLDRHLVPLEYSTMKSELHQVIRQNGGSRNCIIDLTGVTKTQSIGIFSVCLALGIKSVYVFELEDRPDPSHPERYLYHALDEKSYSYTCLSNTEPVRSSESALIRKTPLLWLVLLTALIVMAVSFYMVATIGPDSLPLQVINLAAAVVGLASPALTLVERRKGMNL